MKDNDLTVTLKDGRRVPCYQAGVLQQDFSFMDDGKVTVSTAEEQDREKGEVDCHKNSETVTTLKTQRLCAYLL